MSGQELFLRRQGPRLVVLVVALAVGLMAANSVDGRQRQPAVLKIGTSGSLSGNGSGNKEEAALTSLRQFIKDETGLSNEILRQKDWRELGDKMAKGELHLGVFQGVEYAWAQAKSPGLKPLALAVNVHLYPVAFVVTRKDSKVKESTGLQGATLVVPASAPQFLHLFVNRQTKANGTKEEKPSKVTFQKTAEDALDDVVDGVAQAAAVDQAALEAYKRRKPGRFNQLKELAHSEPFPPAVVAYHGKTLDEALLKRFREGLQNAARKEKGRMMLTLFRLTTFRPVQGDFDKVVTRTLKAYPPPQDKER